MADPISDQCFDLALRLYACQDSTLEDCGRIRQLVEGVENELLAARNKIRADEEHLPTIGRLTQDLHETEQELLAARAEVERLNGLLPLLMKLWDAAKEAAGTISMRQEHSCYHTYGFLDKEPALKMIDALEELRLWKNKETP